MTLAQAAFLVFAASLPVASMIGVARGVFCVCKLAKDANWNSVLIVGFGIGLSLVTFCVAGIVWFITAVSHAPNDQSGDLVWLASTGLVIYVTNSALWIFCSYTETGSPSKRVRADPANSEPG